MTGSEETTYEGSIDQMNPDTLRDDDGWDTETTGVATGGNQSLSNGVYISFSTQQVIQHMMIPGLLQLLRHRIKQII